MNPEFLGFVTNGTGSTDILAVLFVAVLSVGSGGQSTTQSNVEIFCESTAVTEVSTPGGTKLIPFVTVKAEVTQLFPATALRSDVTVNFAGDENEYKLADGRYLCRGCVPAVTSPESNPVLQLQVYSRSSAMNLLVDVGNLAEIRNKLDSEIPHSGDLTFTNEMLAAYLESSTIEMPSDESVARTDKNATFPVGCIGREVPSN